MKLWKPILVLTLVFLAGIALGVVGTRVAIRHYLQTALTHPERLQDRIERTLQRQLRLDGAQSLELTAILTDTRTELRALRVQYQPQAVDILHRADTRITKLLTSDQLARYEKLKAQNPALQRVLQNGP